MKNIELNLEPETQLVTVNDLDPTISVLWDRAVQQAVIEAQSGPTIASRAYAMVHTAMYDAWSAYVETPISTNLKDDLQRPRGENTQANKSEAMSYAAYHVSIELFPQQQAIFDRQMLDLGYDTSKSLERSDPAGIGYISANALLDFRLQDGANQLGTASSSGKPYSDYTGYQASNQPDSIEYIELWTPEVISIDDSESRTQEFLTPQWGKVTPFALESGSQFRPDDPQPFLLVDGTVDLDAKTITRSDETVLNISRDLIGTVINPEFIAQATEVIQYSANLTDEQKLIAEFWEDGTGTSYPPGTSMTFGQYVSARDNHTLDEDARMFFALGNAVFDAGIAAWDAKVFYDYARPVNVVKELGELGLIGEYNADLDGYTIEAYSSDRQGVQTILAKDFITYQTPNSDYSPPFAEYVSGHSTFSTAIAEVLQQFTDSDRFGASVVFAPGSSRFEPGSTPANTTVLSWDTFSEAANESGISRLYGGIHFTEGDLNGRTLGREVGNAVFDRTQFYVNGGDINTDREGIIGTLEADFLVGTKKGDRLYGLAGNDTLDGGKDDDSIEGGLGQDSLLGDKGDDTLFGGEGNDTLDGGKDDDSIEGDSGQDFILGDKGDDTLFGGEGSDRLYGDKDDDLLDGGLGIDELVGGKGKDLFVLRIGDSSDRIEDYSYKDDKFLLVDGLTFGDLQFDYDPTGTQIIVTETNESLATIANVSVERLDRDSFVTEV